MKKVGYIYSEELSKELDKIPAFTERSQIVHSLIKSYGLLNDIKLLQIREATDDELKRFHTTDYLEYIKSHADSLDTSDIDEDDIEFGFGYDCPKINGIHKFCTTVAGATISVAEAIAKKEIDVGINWNGGWHHAHRDSAAGFCYINDIVIGISILSEQFKRILYVDLDVHHGDGVEEAFSTTKRVLTLSYHIHEPGYFPCSGGTNSCGTGQGHGFTVNAPYKFNMDFKFCSYFKKVFDLVVDKFNPDAFVIQCGADVLSGDPIGAANLTIDDMKQCIEVILLQNGPKLFLGGGGYCPQNASRYWTELTALILGKTLDEDIPDNDDFFLKYGPHYTIKIERKRLKDSNTEDSLENNLKTIRENLKFIQNKT